jgi:hypothetical protein
MSKRLSEFVQVERHFLRSVNISLDFGRPDAIAGYVLQPSAQQLLQIVGNHLSNTQQKAFTWTGPYGGGKSLLALSVASLAGGEEDVSQMAQNVLTSEQTQEFVDYFATEKSWLVLPVTGRRADISEEIESALMDGYPELSKSKKTIINKLKYIAEHNTEYEGVLLIVDELGKFLEHAAFTGGDIGFYQELAETAARCKGKLVVIGILHQAFEQYASRLGTAMQQEWAKVQGRYVDIPLLASSDETLSLISKAVKNNYPHPQNLQTANQIAKLTPNQNEASFTQLLDDCWPLHPLTALMLGPASRKRFGQNERSIFSFLTSAEPFGFSEKIQTLAADAVSLYWPHYFWDYLKANFEPTIQASSDGHRWALMTDALSRTEARFPLPHVQLVKIIGLIELFRSGLAISAKLELLYISLPYAQFEIDTALSDLAQASVLIFRKHLNAWAIYAGSDFDIDEAVSAAKQTLGTVDLSKAQQNLALNPVIARRHYAEKGAIRWLNRTVILEHDADKHLSSIKFSGNCFGEFLLVVPTDHHTDLSLQQLQSRLTAQAPKGVLIGLSTNARDFIQQLQELSALEHIRSHREELHADQVALREIEARTQAIKHTLTDDIQALFNQAAWWYKLDLQVGGLTQIASQVANQIYLHTPSVLSELVNRNTLSSNAVKAQKDLLRAMLSKNHLENFGFESMSAAAGLYHTTLKTLGMHRQIDGIWQICSPAGKEKSGSVLKLWQTAEEELFKAQALTKLSDLYARWSKAPIGLNHGLLPIFALAFYLANRKHLAVYMDGVFTPDITEATLDEWLQDPKRVAWRFVKLDSTEQEILQALSQRLSSQLNRFIAQDPLDSARALVSIVFSLAPWVRRTEQLPAETKKIRQLLLHASDPHKVLFVDIPTLLDTTDAYQIADRISLATSEMVKAFGLRLKKIESHLFTAIDQHDHNFSILNSRGKQILGIGAEFKLDAFIGRITTYQGQSIDIEGLLMLAIGRPSKDWTDHDLDAGEVQLLQWAERFRRLEVVAHLRDKSSNRRGIGIVFGNQQTITGSFDIAETDQSLVQDLSIQLLSQLKSQQHKKEVFLAALAEAGAKILQDLNLVDG